MPSFPTTTTTFGKKTTAWQTKFSQSLLMTGLAIFLMLGAFLIPSANKAQAHPGPVSTSPIQLSGLTMIDPQHGWALNDSKHVFSTHQGPEHWTDVTPAFLIDNPDSIITNSFFLDATRGYIGVLQEYNTVLLSTQDSGRTWQTTPFDIPIIADPVAIHQITFIDAQHGWISFNRNQRQPGQFDILLMSTSNGGKTWQTVLDTSVNPTNLPIPYSQSSNFTFINPQTGWVTGIWLSGDVYLYSTHDGGKTWSKSSITAIKGANDIYFTQGDGPYWQNSQDGTLFVRYDTESGNGMPHITSYQTHDAGKSWILGPSSPSTSYQELNIFSAISAKEGWSFGFDGQGNYVIHHASNGGLSWNIIQPTGLIPASADTQVLVSMSYINTKTAWLIIKDDQYNYHLFQTNNGGRSWSTLQPTAS